MIDTILSKLALFLVPLLSLPRSVWTLLTVVSCTLFSRIYSVLQLPRQAWVYVYWKVFVCVSIVYRKVLEWIPKFESPLHRAWAWVKSKLPTRFIILPYIPRTLRFPPPMPKLPSFHEILVHIKSLIIGGVAFFLLKPIWLVRSLIIWILSSLLALFMLWVSILVTLPVCGKPKNWISRGMWIQWVRRNYALAHALFPILGAAGPEATYDYIGKEGSYLSESTTFLNFGYWAGLDPAKDSLDEAEAALAMKLADEAIFDKTNTVLDAGCGFGDAAFLWARKIKPKSIVGLNMTRSQVKHAVIRAYNEKVSEGMSFVVGSATAMPFPPEQFDRVTALESAFHFRTRQKFLSESYRVLKPGGVLAMADIVLRPSEAPSKRNFISRLVYAVLAHVGLAFWAIPMENLSYDTFEYVHHLEAAGFTNVKVTSIFDDVLPPFAQYVTRNWRKNLFQGMNPLFLAILYLTARLTTKGKTANTPIDYVLVIATKP